MKPLTLSSWWTGVALMAVSGMALTHSGRTNSEGCHNDRRNGTYHCHSGSSAPSVTPRRSAPPSVKVPQVPEIYFPSATPAQRPSLHTPVKPSARAPQVPRIYYPSSGSAPEPSVSETGGAQFYFSSCEQARSIGKSVLRTVEEGYRPELDGNRNGIACEPADAL